MFRMLFASFAFFFVSGFPSAWASVEASQGLKFKCYRDDNAVVELLIYNGGEKLSYSTDWDWDGEYQRDYFHSEMEGKVKYFIDDPDLPYADYELFVAEEMLKGQPGVLVEQSQTHLMRSVFECQVVPSF